ncbi:MAG: twin-arginine translocation signal domain-containing protein, partial [Candidatus Hydrogenedentota bacterium]
MTYRSLSRRSFLKGAAGAVGAGLIGPRVAVGRVERLAPTD